MPTDAIPVHRYSPAYGATPRLKRVEVTEAREGGRPVFALRDPAAPDAPALQLSAEALAIASFFDGAHDLRAVQLAIFKQYGQLIYVERVHELARALWLASFFEGPAPAGDGADALAEFRQTPRRAAVHAGGAYEADPARLRRQLDDLFLHPDGPGAAPGPLAARRIAGIVAPHIDLHRGGPAYAHAYKALAEGTDADLFVVFGTAHVSPTSLFTLTRRDYDTPLGPVPTDAAVVDALLARLGDGLLADELVHRDEHAIEFQAVWLRHLAGDRPVTMLPILCSSLYGSAARGERPDSEPEVNRFLDALREVLANRRVCFIAAADLSHVGILFGDDAAPAPDDLHRLRDRDLASLGHALAGDANGFFDHVAPDAETRRICGLSPIYLALRAAGAVTGRLLRYDQWVGIDEGSAVTYAAAVLDPA